MLEWLFAPAHHPVVDDPIPPPPLDLVNSLPFSSQRALLGGDPGAPFSNDSWTGSPGGRNVVYLDRITHEPLFSGRDQINQTNECVGKLQFLHNLKNSKIFINSQNDLMTSPPRHILSHQPESVCEAGTTLKVNYRIGGEGPGGREMAISRQYQLNGPHRVGRLLPSQRIYCVEPSAVEKFDRTVTLAAKPEQFKEYIEKVF